MAIEIPTTEKLVPKYINLKGVLWILHTSVLVLLFLLFFIPSQKISAQVANTWWDNSTAITQEQRDITYGRFNATFRGYVESGNDYIIAQRSTPNLACIGIVSTNSANKMTISDSATVGLLTVSTSPSNNMYYQTIAASTCVNNTGSTSNNTSSSPLGLGGLTNINSARITNVSFTNGTTPTKTPTEINDTLKLTPPFVPDPNWYNTALQLAPDEIYVPVASALSESNRCYQSKSMSGWRKLINQYLETNPTSSDVITAMERLDDIIANGNGGWLVAQDSSEEIARLQLFTYQGTAQLTWETPTPTYPNGRVFIPNTGITQRTLTTIEISCNQFNTNGHQPLVSTNLSYTGSFRIDVHTQTNRTGGLWCPTTCEMFRRMVFASGNMDHNYPSGYTGVLIPESGYEAEKLHAKTYTDFDVIMTGYSLNAEYRGHEYDDSRCTFIHWRIVGVENRDDVYPTDRVKSHYTQINQPLTLLLEETAFYRLDAVWSWATTDLDFSNSGLDQANKQYCREQVIAGSGPISLALEAGLIPMNSGKVFPIDPIAREIYGYSNNRECEIDEQSYHETGFYPPSMLCVYETDWALEDCAVYGIEELHLRIGCELNNFRKLLRASLIQFFVPYPGAIQATFNGLLEEIKSKTSILTYPMFFIVNTMNQMIQQSNQCTIFVDDIYSSSTTIDLCYMRTKWFDLWNLATMVFRISMVISLMFALYKVLLKVFSVGAE